MRSVDTEVHPVAIERAAKKAATSTAAKQRLIVSSLIVVAALVFVFVKDQPIVGFTSALIAAGIVAPDTIKAMLGR